jgi:ParB/RepB/Spo0J family partition protein
MTPHESHAKPNGHIPQAIPVAAAEGPNPNIERIEAALVSPSSPLESERIKVKLAVLSLDLHNAHKHSPEAIDFLATSIAEKGLINEPLVYRDQGTGRLTLIAGEARVRAMIQLGWEATYVRCLQGAFTEQQLRDLALIDNLLKEEIDPLAFGLYCKDEMDRSGRSARELAKVLSNKVNASTITRNVALVNKLPTDLHELIRSSQLPPAVARVLTGLKDDDTKRHFARLYVEGQVKSGAELAAAIKAARNGQAAAPAGSFICEEEGCKITVNLSPGGNLTAAETALRVVLEDLRKHGKRGLEHWKTFLAKKKAHAKKAAELKAAQEALTRHGSGGNASS